MGSPSACAIVIFGASGDLAHRKLIPAIYDLVREGLLGDRFYVVGFARSPMSDEQYRSDCRAAVAEHGRSKSIDSDIWARVAERTYYFQAEYDAAADYQRLSETLCKLDQRHNVPCNRVFYLATPPAQFQPIIEHLGQTLPRHEQERPCACREENPAHWVRLIIEKPFGHDLASARQLNRLVHSHFAEDQVFRIDHYLGKETVQNLMVLRFANSIFEPIWNYKYIDHVQITVSESLGVGGRGGYYDHSGALRDMVQNHLFQLMSLIAMEPPVALDAVSVRDEKVKVYRSIRPIRPGTVDHFTVRGQYGPGEHANQRTEGYLKEKGVAPYSRTETFTAMRLFIDNWRWSGMPFYLRTGKFLEQKLSEVVVRFRSPPLTLFQKQCDMPVYPNDLVIRVQPDEGVSLRLNGKVPGSQMNIKSVALDFLYSTTFHKAPPEAYERLIYDAISGDQTLFIREDETEAAWSVVDAIGQGWAQSEHAPHPYAPGSWGPRQANQLIELDGRRWLHTTGAPEPIIACSL